MDGLMETVGEIIEFAISREVAASEFYLRAAELMESAVMRDLCHELAKVELEHKATLEFEVPKSTPQ